MSHRELFTWWRLFVGVVLLIGLALSIFELSGNERIWRYFERLHHCQVSSKNGQWTTYTCDDGLVYSRQKSR